MPDFPAEIRAPAGTLAGVSGFQVHFSSQNVLTPGDAPQVLVAMNPAALKASLPELQRSGTIIVNTDSFTKQNLSKAGYGSNPLEDDSLDRYQVLAIPMTSLNREALAEFAELTNKERDRCQNFFALGMVFWMFDRSMKTTREWLFKKFGPANLSSPRPTSKADGDRLLPGRGRRRPSSSATWCALPLCRPVPIAK